MTSTRGLSPDTLAPETTVRIPGTSTPLTVTYRYTFIPGIPEPANPIPVEDLWPVRYTPPTIDELMPVPDPTDDHDLLAVEWPCSCKSCYYLEKARSDYEWDQLLEVMRERGDAGEDYDEDLWDED